MKVVVVVHWRLGVGDHIICWKIQLIRLFLLKVRRLFYGKMLVIAKQAAEAMKITAPDLKELGVIDEIIPEVKGGAHRRC